MSLIERSAVELLALLQSGEVSSVQVTEAFLEQIDKHDGEVQSFLEVRPALALEQAEAVDERRRNGERLGRLAGLPIAIKDVLCTKGEPTTCGSKMLENFVPPYDATVVERLRAADAVLIGKTNMDEFAMGGSTENSAFQKTKNPWDLERIPGGSSGGAAACLAASMAPLSIGTDTGGSIRQPAAFCGVTGLKPTYGRVSRYGLVAFASSLDQIGPMACSAEDTALLLEVMAGHDPRDSTSLQDLPPPYSLTVKEPLAGLTLGVAKEHFEQGLDKEVEQAVRAAIKQYEALGAKIKEVSLPHGKYGIAVYYIIAPCEASSNLARFDSAHYGYRTNEAAMTAQLNRDRAAARALGPEEEEKVDSPLVRMYRQSRAEGFGPEVKRRIMLGTYALSRGYYDAYYVKALKVRRLIREDYDKAFKDVDLIVGPCTPTPPFKIGEKSDDPLAMYLGDLYTVTANLAGIPGLSFPCGATQGGLPIGLQLQGPPLAEDKLLRACHLYQQATDWHKRRPALPG